MPDFAKKSVVRTFEQITTIFSQENDNFLLAYCAMNTFLLRDEIGDRIRLSGPASTKTGVRLSAAGNPD